jgi:hypothetical protein
VAETTPATQAVGNARRSGIPQLANGPAIRSGSNTSGCPLVSAGTSQRSGTPTTTWTLVARPIRSPRRRIALWFNTAANDRLRLPASLARHGGRDYRKAQDVPAPSAARVAHRSEDALKLHLAVTIDRPWSA